MSTHNFRGKVILAGAGPGDPELITRKAFRYLQTADVIITDRLVSEELINSTVKGGATVIYVGKQAGQNSSAPQAEINELLVANARRNKLVLRLKGGDVSFFSNVLDELRTLTHHGIPYEIVPGITAASGASAYAGIPLTARGYAASVRFLTFYQPEEWREPLLKELALTDDTLVFYMSSEKLDVLVERLQEHGINKDKYIAVIEQATTPSQQVRVVRLNEYDEKLRGAAFVSPCLVIIGQVAGLHEEFKWIDNNIEGGSYFRPVNEFVEQQS